MMIRVALRRVGVVALFLAAGLALLAATAQEAAQGPAGPKPATGARLGAVSLSAALRMAETGHCPEALAPLKKALAGQLTPADRKFAALAGARCAMALDRTGDAIRFVESLGDAFQSDPEIGRAHV